MKAMLVLFALLGSTPALMGSGQRLWRYTDGRTFTAQYQWAGPETIYLKNPDGKQFEVALGALCNDDLAYVRAIATRLKDEGIIYEAPLVWEEYRSKDFTTQEADQAGYYRLDSRVTSGGSLRLEFRRFGDAPRIAPNQRAVLRMTTAHPPDAGTASQIHVIHEGKVTGATSSAVPPRHTFDIVLSPRVLMGGNRINLDVKCGSDRVLVRTGKSGAGPRLLIVQQSSD